MMMQNLEAQASSRSRWIIVGVTAILAIGIGIDLYGLPLLPSRDRPTVDCQGKPTSEGRLTEQQVAQFLAIPEGVPKQQLRAVVPEPTCRLPDIQVRAGAIAQREAYQLGFEEQVWLVVLYEGDRYTGYRFAP